MKKLLSTTLFIAALFTISLNYSCKKKDGADGPGNLPTLDAKVFQHNTDNNTYKDQSDQTDSELNEYLKDDIIIGKTANDNRRVQNTICGCTVDTSQKAQKILIFKFDGVTPCGPSPSRTRAGDIQVQLTSGNRWADAGSELTITYINYKVTILTLNRAITFNGVKTLHNINGNDWIKLGLGLTTFKYRERALNIAVSFDNGLNATWNSARITEWSWITSGTKKNNLAFKAVGDTTVNSFSNVDSWGVNRYGNIFTTYYTSPINSDTYCWLWRFTSGQLIHNINSNNYTLTLGVDQNGNASTLNCAYGYKISWVDGGGASQSRVYSY